MVNSQKETRSQCRDLGRVTQSVAIEREDQWRGNIAEVITAIFWFGWKLQRQWQRRIVRRDAAVVLCVTRSCILTVNINRKDFWDGCWRKMAAVVGLQVEEQKNEIGDKPRICRRENSSIHCISEKAVWEDWKFHLCQHWFEVSAGRLEISWRYGVDGAYLTDIWNLRIIAQLDSSLACFDAVPLKNSCLVPCHWTVVLKSKVFGAILAIILKQYQNMWTDK